MSNDKICLLKITQVIESVYLQCVSSIVDEPIGQHL